MNRTPPAPRINPGGAKPDWRPGPQPANQLVRPTFAEQIELLDRQLRRRRRQPVEPADVAELRRRLYRVERLLQLAGV